MERQINGREDDTAIDGAVKPVIFLAAIAVGRAGPAMAQACSHEGPVVTCDDGRRGVRSGDAIIGNKLSVKLGPGVFVGQGKGSVALDDPNAPNKMRCAILDGVSYCY